MDDASELQFLSRDGSRQLHMLSDPSNSNRTSLCPSYMSTTKIIVYFYGVLMMVSVTATVIVMAIMAHKRLHFSTENNLVIAESPCSSLEKIKTTVHLLLNILGTLTLGTSNFLQQLCTSPTTSDVYEYLPKRDIKFGANMPSELFSRRGWWRKCIWVLLILTSVPIHLALNGILASDTVPVSTPYTELGNSQSTAFNHTGYKWISTSDCVNMYLIQYEYHSYSFIDRSPQKRFKGRRIYLRSRPSMAQSTRVRHLILLRKGYTLARRYLSTQ